MNEMTYSTKAGSTVTVSGKHSGIFTISFDWFEEDACIECEPHYDQDNNLLVWDCDYCGGGSTELILVKKEI